MRRRRMATMMRPLADAARSFADGWREMWRDKADEIRADRAAFVDQWERDAGPGYPLPPLSAQRRDLSLAMADLCDSLGGRRHNNAPREDVASGYSCPTLNDPDVTPLP